ncbi:MAG: sugar transferase [Bacilli bacterium]|nr:sugar transferase [Bacilli bacterium]
MKRLFDIICSFFGIVLLSPLYLLFIIIIPCTSKGGPFYLAERIGRNGKTIHIVKFRSMKKASFREGSFTIKDSDDRITKVGRFIRKTKIDEFPQLFNVFIGQMSLVGPRPEVPPYAAGKLGDASEEEILSVRPGMTDWASIVLANQYALVNDSENSEVFFLTKIRPFKIYMQKYYVHNHSFFSDLLCILWTVRKVATRTKKLPKKVQAAVDKFQLEIK